MPLGTEDLEPVPSSSAIAYRETPPHATCETCQPPSMSTVPLSQSPKTRTRCKVMSTSMRPYTEKQDNRYPSNHLNRCTVPRNHTYARSPGSLDSCCGRNGLICCCCRIDKNEHIISSNGAKTASIDTDDEAFAIQARQQDDKKEAPNENKAPHDSDERNERCAPPTRRPTSPATLPG